MNVEAGDEAGDEAKGEDGASSFGLAEKIGDYHFGPVTGAAALADGGVATCGADGIVRGWDLATGACAWRVDAGGAPLAGSASGSLAAGCDRFAVASEGGVVRVYQSRGAAPRLLLRVRLTVAAPDALAMSPSGTRLVVAGDEKDGCWFVETDSDAARVVGRS